MILHLTGSSETARMLIADRLLDNRPDWRYMALEDMFDGEIPDEINDMHMMNTMLACDIATEETGPNANLIVTTPFVELIEAVQQHMDGDHVTVLLGTEDNDPEQFDYVIDTANMSTDEAVEALNTIMNNHEE